MKCPFKSMPSQLHILQSYCCAFSRKQLPKSERHHISSLFIVMAIQLCKQRLSMRATAYWGNSMTRSSFPSCFDTSTPNSWRRELWSRSRPGSRGLKSSSKLLIRVCAKVLLGKISVLLYGSQMDCTSASLGRLGKSAEEGSRILVSAVAVGEEAHSGFWTNDMIIP
jgi:hypothetical protein